MFQAEVLSCTERSGTGRESGKPYRFFILNLVIAGPDGKRVAGEVTVDEEVKPGRYQVGLSVEVRQGRITPLFKQFAAAR